MTVSCRNAVATVNTDECRPANCTAGQSVTFVLGATTQQYALPGPLASGNSTLVDCSVISTLYSGQATVSCEAGRTTSNVNGCTLNPGIQTVTETVVESAVSLTMPATAGTSASETEASMNKPEAKAAFAKSLASSLGTTEDKVRVLGVTVIQGTRRLEAAPERRLAPMQVSVQFQVIVPQAPPASTDTSSGAPSALTLNASSIAAKVRNLTSPSSQQNQMFTSTIGANLQQAAAASGDTSLTRVSQTVVQQGITVKGVAAPQTVSVQIVPTQPKIVAFAQKDDDASSGPVALGVSMSMLGLFLCSGLMFARYFPDVVKSCPKNTREACKRLGTRHDPVMEIDNGCRASGCQLDERPPSSGSRAEPEAEDDLRAAANAREGPENIQVTADNMKKFNALRQLANEEASVDSDDEDFRLSRPTTSQGCVPPGLAWTKKKPPQDSTPDRPSQSSTEAPRPPSILLEQDPLTNGLPGVPPPKRVSSVVSLPPIPGTSPHSSPARAKTFGASSSSSSPSKPSSVVALPPVHQHAFARRGSGTLIDDGDREGGTLVQAPHAMDDPYGGTLDRVPSPELQAPPTASSSDEHRPDLAATISQS